MKRFRIVKRNSQWDAFYVFPALVLCLGRAGIGFAFLWWGIEIYLTAEESK